MKWENAKKADQLKLDGITFETEIVNGELHSIIMKDLAGNRIRFVQSNYEVRIQVPAKPEKRKVWRVSWGIAGQMQHADFDSK